MVQAHRPNTPRITSIGSRTFSIPRSPFRGSSTQDWITSGLGAIIAPMSPISRYLQSPGT